MIVVHVLSVDVTSRMEAAMEDTGGGGGAGSGLDSVSIALFCFCSLFFLFFLFCFLRRLWTSVFGRKCGEGSKFAGSETSTIHFSAEGNHARTQWTKLGETGLEKGVCKFTGLFCPLGSANLTSSPHVPVPSETNFRISKRERERRAWLRKRRRNERLEVIQSISHYCVG